MANWPGPVWNWARGWRWGEVGEVGRGEVTEAVPADVAAGATCETQVSRCSARRAALVLSAGGRGQDSTGVDIPGKPGGAPSFPAAASRPRTTSHPRTSGTGDCQSGGGVAAISSKNISLLCGERNISDSSSPSRIEWEKS